MSSPAGASPPSSPPGIWRRCSRPSAPPWSTWPGSTNRLIIESALPEHPAKALALVTGGVEVYLPLAGMVDLEREQERLRKELAAVEGDIARAQGLLGNERFVSKAPAEVVQKEREKLAAAEERRGVLATRIEMLAGMA